MAFRVIGSEHPCSCAPAGWGSSPPPKKPRRIRSQPAEMAIVEEAMSSHLIGEPETVHAGLVQLQDAPTPTNS